MNIFKAYFENPTNIFFASQEKDEKVIFVLRAAFITNFPWVFFGILFLILPQIYMRFVLINPKLSIINPPQLENTIIIIWYLVVIGFILQSYISWYFNVYIVTNKRLLDVDFIPLFYKRVSETNYDKVEDSSYEMNNFFQTVFNYGTVFVQTAAENREFEFKNVPNPAKVQDIISDYANKASEDK